MSKKCQKSTLSMPAATAAATYAGLEVGPIITSPADMAVSGFSVVSFDRHRNGKLYVVDFSGTLHMVVQRP